MRCFSRSASSIYQISCAAQRMNTIIDMPRSVFPCLPSVHRWICISKCLPQHLSQTTPGWNICRRHFVVPLLRWQQWCAPLLHTNPFRPPSNCFEPASGFQLHKIQSELPTASLWISSAKLLDFLPIAPVIFIDVFDPCNKKSLACDTEIGADAATADNTFIWDASTHCGSSHLPIVPYSRSLYQVLNFWDGRLTMLMYVSASLVSSFLPFTQIHISHSIMGWTSHFTSIYFGYNHRCNYHNVFYSSQKIGPRITDRKTTIGTYVVVLSSSCTVSSKKNVSLCFGLT